MGKKHTFVEIIIFILSIVGFLGGIIIPIIGSIIYRYWGNIISSNIFFNLFLIFAFFSSIGIIIFKIKYRLKEKNHLMLFSIKIAYIGLIINGFWILLGLPGYLY